MRYKIVACSVVVALISVIFIIAFYNRPDGMDKIRKVATIKNTDTSENRDFGMQVPINFEELKKINSDIYAWITVPGTKIDYPLLRSQEEDFYLTHDAEKKESVYGALYTQSYNKDDFTDFNTVIYGHNMINGSMLGELDKYKKEEFFNKYQDVYIYQPNRILQYRIFAAYVFDNTHILLDYNFNNMAQRVEYIDIIYSGKYTGNFLEEPKAFASDKIITLSTCLTKDDERFVVQAMLISDSYDQE